jgi:hypothetical protein
MTISEKRLPRSYISEENGNYLNPHVLGRFEWYLNFNLLPNKTEVFGLVLEY